MLRINSLMVPPKQVKAAKKNQQTGALSVSVEHGAHLEKILEYGRGPGDVPEFMAADLLPALEVVTSIVLCRQVSVSRLSAAVAKLEESAERQGDDASSSGCALFHFLLGKGRALCTPAASILKERQLELLHVQLVNDLKLLQRRSCQGSGQDLSALGQRERAWAVPRPSWQRPVPVSTRKKEVSL